MNRIALVLILMFATCNVLALGQTGHRVTGEIAEKYLTPETKLALQQLFGNESLAEVSTYADELRGSNSKFWKKTAYPYHFVTIPDGKDYQDVGAPPEGDALFALEKYSKILRAPESTKQEKQTAVRLIVHIIGDLHQPLHVGNGKDRGGNHAKVKFFGRDSNLHYVWDSGMIKNQELSYTEWTNWLHKQISPQEVALWSVTNPLVWVRESQAIRMEMYPEDGKVHYEYQFKFLPVLKMRMKQAGVRIAAVLNELMKQ
ncbi:S1/P1 nuclease [Aliikangiella sp. IMCC44653]